MKKFVAAILCAVMAQAAHAENKTCLNDLQGDFYHQRGNKLNHIVTVAFNNGSWGFNSPSEDYDVEYTSDLRYQFDRTDRILAKPVSQEYIQSVGMVMLSPYMEKSIGAKGVSFECGLVANGFYVMNIDLSEANQELIKNLAIFARSYERSSEPPSLQEINEMRKQKYFLGEPLQLVGVINTIIGSFLHKR